MTTRGTNPSISPPVQIQQPRHVSGIQSGTPPPNQQLYHGQSPGLVQGPTFNYIQPQYQGEQLLSYQAYGSAPNDLRAATAPSGRGGTGPANMAQSGAFYHQPNQNMRPSQPPPPNQSQPYYIGPSGQGAMRHTRPTHPPNQAMYIIPQNNNMVMPANMYQPAARMPLYTNSGPQYQPRYPGQGGMMYFGNGMPRGPSVLMQTPGMGPQPAPREKRLITISDPNTGRNITDELIKSQHQQQQPTEEKGEQDDSSANDKGAEIRKNFTRQVVERMKTGETAPSSHQHPAESVNSAAPLQNQPSQEHPQLPAYTPPQQQQQQSTPPVAGAPGPGSMIRPSMRMPSPGAINLSVPPPQLPHNLVYNSNRHAQNQQAVPNQVQTNIPTQPQPVLQTKGPLPPSAASVVMVDSAPLTRSVETSPATHEIQPVERKPIPARAEPIIPQSDIPTQLPPAAVPAVVQADKSSPRSATFQENSSQSSVNQNPAQDHVSPTTTPQNASVPTEKTSTDSSVPAPVSMPAPVSTKQTAVSKDVPAPAEEKQPSPEPAKPPVVEVPKPVETTKLKTAETETAQGKEEATLGANAQGNKDGRKGKKGKKDFSRKESGGSEMDAFIDGKDSGVDIEQGQAVVEQQKSPDTLPQDVPVTPSDKVLKNAEELPPVAEKESSPAPVPTVADEKIAPTEESKLDNYVAEKETEVVKTETTVQNGTDVQMEKEASVPKDDSPPVVHSVPEEIQETVGDAELSKTDNQDLYEENGAPKIEEVESKAEAFAKLKKSGGKLVYDRSYLMELRECASSQTKPDGLPKLEIILDKPNPSLSRPSAGPADFTPAFFQTAANQRHAPPIGKSSSRGRQRPGDMPNMPRVIKSLSMSSDAKSLHQSENPWKQKKKEDKEEKTLEGDILFIMNRLTPTNFEKMAVLMKKLDVKTYEDLQLMVKIFFEKATIETKFVEAYAQLCKVMSGLKVPPPSDGSVKEHLATFRVVMLTKCQQEFEADKTIIFENPEEKKKKLEAEFPEGTPDRSEKIENILYQMKLKRMKFYGNVRFIGELFKLGLLTENIMHDCMFRLLKARDDDSLVSLSNLLTTVGRNLDTDKAKPRMDQYFQQMTKIAEERKTRIKFILKDVIELRQNHWVPRKETAGPKKIDEVHKDFAQEQARNQYLASQPPPPRNDNQAGSRRGSRQRPDEKPNDDGWNTVSSKAVRMIDASKMKFSKNVMDENIQLGPGGGVHRQSLWGRGSHGGAQPSQEDRQSGSNRFSALTNDDARRSFPRSPSRGEGSAGRGYRQGPTAGHGRGKIMSRSSQEGDRRDLLSNNRFMGGRSQNSSRDNSWNRDERRQYLGPRSSGERDNPMTRSDSGVHMEEFRAPAPAVKQMSESDIETKACNILDEYLSIRDLGEVKLCVKELTGQNLIHLIVTACINNVLEKKDEARQLTGDLFHVLVSCNLLPVNMYIKGLNEVLQYASDMVVDIPTMWNCLAQVICPLLVGGSLPWSKLKQAFTPYLDNKDGAKLLAAIISYCVEKQSEKEVSHQWQNSGLSWSAYLKADEISSFVSDKKLEFTLRGNSSQSSADDLVDIERMIRNRASNVELISYIEKIVPGSKSDNSFIRALTTAVVSACISESNSLNEDVLRNHKDVLQKYLGNNVDLQLQALYAIQTLMAKLEHPSGLLSKLFESCYLEISVEEDAFYKWEKCTDPQEQEAKGTCLMQVRQFFIWLRENEEPES